MSTKHNVEKTHIIRILQILEKYSDKAHPLTQKQILLHLQEDFGITLERKAVGHSLDCLDEMFLQDGNSPLERSKKGVWIAERQFEDNEIRLLVDCVLSNKHVSESASEKLVEKLKTLASPSFRAQKQLDKVYVSRLSKTASNAIFGGVDTISQAIEGGKQVEFQYSSYDKDGNLCDRSVHTVSPYKIIMHGGNYYLVCFDKKYNNLATYRLDKIRKVKELSLDCDDISGKSKSYGSIDSLNALAKLPFMAADDRWLITFEVIKDDGAVNQVRDWFGDTAKFKTGTKDAYVFEVVCSAFAMEQWASLFADFVKIITPDWMQAKIVNRIRKSAEKYGIKTI